MLRAIILVVLVGGLLTLMGLAGRHFFSHSEGADVELTSAPSIQQIREVGELIGKIPAYHINEGISYYRLKLYDRAVKSFTRALAIPKGQHHKLATEWFEAAIRERQ